MNENPIIISTISEMIRGCCFKFSWVHPEITDERFPVPARIWTDYKVFNFGIEISSPEVVSRMQVECCEPANPYELLLWEGWNKKNAAVALGFVVDVNGNDCVLCFDKFLFARHLCLDSWGGDWHPSCRFLGVRK